VEPLTLPRALYQELLALARRALPNECCGLLAGRGRAVTRVFRATNSLASPTAYEIRPRELFALFRKLREEKLDLAGIYHSHPTGDNFPSARDRQRAYYPETPYVIVSPRADAPRPVRAFLLSGERVEEISVEVLG
jgi:proteasome lid subunit RPN8/RPN11